MARFQFKGLKEYAEYLQRIGMNSKEICGEAVYTMANIVTDEIRKNLDALPTINEAKAVKTYRDQTQGALTSSQKKGLQASLGISKIENDNGYWNVKVGFDGYNKVKTRKYPNGQPNAMIARATESGSSVRVKTPFIRPAVNASQKRAIEAAKIKVDQRIFAVKKKEG